MQRPSYQKYLTIYIEGGENMKKNPGRKERRALEKRNRDAEGKARMLKHNGLKENQGIRKK